MSTDNFWLETFGDVEYAYDFAGFRIKRSEYNNRNSVYGWNIDHLIPLSKNGLNSKCNKAIASIIANDQKADKTSFVIEFDDVKEYYQVQKIANNPARGTMIILQDSDYPNDVVWIAEGA